MTPTRRRLIAALGVIAVCVVLAIPAIGANHTNTQDANDTNGDLDLRAIALDHYPRPLRWTFRTFAGWTVSDMWDHGYLVVELDTRGDKSIDERIVVRSDGRMLVAKLFTVRGGSERPIADLRATKDGRSAATVEVALRRLGVAQSRDAFHWYALSLFSGAGCKRVCIDRVPDDGRLEQLLPGASPTPEPTGPTGTPEPSGATGTT
jgi:hypothetical protein